MYWRASRRCEKREGWVEWPRHFIIRERESENKVMDISDATSEERSGFTVGFPVELPGTIPRDSFHFLKDSS
jgi:hypothetical protein